MLHPECSNFDMKFDSPDSPKDQGDVAHREVGTAPPIVLAYCPVEIVTMCDPRQPQPITYSRPSRRRN